ncbi:MAG TPA: hypothetical protein VFI80_12255 [Burkholderiales bacterium]|nr:hypothetical protein [Burkholderiales bacterium]
MERVRLGNDLERLVKRDCLTMVDAQDYFDSSPSRVQVFFSPADPLTGFMLPSAGTRPGEVPRLAHFPCMLGGIAGIRPEQC